MKKATDDSEERDTRKVVSDFVAGYIGSERMAADFDALTPLQRQQVILRLSAYVLPRIKSEDMERGARAESLEMLELKARLVRLPDKG